MNVTWAASSATSGRFVPTEVTTDIVDLAQRFEELRVQGCGYLEVRRASDFPVLTIGFRGNAAVLQLFPHPDATYLLDNGQSGTGSELVPVMDDWIEFSADFVHDVGQAWALVQQFACSGDFASLGRWREL